MGKKSNKSLRDCSHKKLYTDSDEIVNLRRELVTSRNYERYSDDDREQSNYGRGKKQTSFKSLRETKQSRT